MDQVPCPMSSRVLSTPQNNTSRKPRTRRRTRNSRAPQPTCLWVVASPLCWIKPSTPRLMLASTLPSLLATTTPTLATTLPLQHRRLSPWVRPTFKMSVHTSPTMAAAMTSSLLVSTSSLPGSAASTPRTPSPVPRWLPPHRWSACLLPVSPTVKGLVLRCRQYYTQAAQGGHYLNRHNRCTCRCAQQHCQHPRLERRWQVKLHRHH